MERQISTEQVVDAATDGLRNSMHHVMPGAVTAYNTSTQRANVQPMTHNPRTNLDTGQPYFEPWPIITDIRVLWPRFGGFMLSGPLPQGSPVLLMAFDVDPTTWLTQGATSPGSTQAVAPADVRRHGGGYWLAIPLNIFGPIADAAAAANGMVLGVDGDPAQIRFAAGSLQLGSAGGDHVALSSKTDQAINGLAHAINTWTPVPNDGGAALKAALSSWLSTWASGSVASTLIKAQ